MLTEFGRVLRKLRIDRNELSKDMAQRLGVTASYLSAVEHGKREIPSNWIMEIASMYDLNNDDILDLEEAAKKSALSIKIDLKGEDPNKIELANAFARRLTDFEQDDVDKMMEFIAKRGRRED